MKHLFDRAFGHALLSTFAALATAACAHQRPAALPDVLGVAAAFAPLAPEPAGARPSAALTQGDDTPGLGASALLERALEALQAERPPEALRFLQAALATGDLNEAGRTLTYWYVYVAEQALGAETRAQNALADFVAVGQDVLALRQDVRFAEREGSDFVDRFDLTGRVARSRATLSLAWAKRVPAFGRSLAQAVPVHSDEEMAYFVEMAPPCAHVLDRHSKEERLPQAPGSEFMVVKVQLSCSGQSVPTLYFFSSQKQVGQGSGVQPRASQQKLGTRRRRVAAQ